MGWIELRGMWKKNIVSLDEKEVAEARRLLDKYQLKVTDIASPLFKVDWPGAPKSKYSEGKSFNADFSLSQQDEVLERAIAMAKAFGTDRVRCFDFWRLDDQAPYRAAMNEKLHQAAEKCGQNGITLILENEQSCNTATGAEAAKVLDAVLSKLLADDPGLVPVEQRGPPLGTEGIHILCILASGITELLATCGVLQEPFPGILQARGVLAAIALT